MRRETAAERSAWTAHIEGTAEPKRNKYGNVRTEGYASKHEAEVVGNLEILERAGKIHTLRKQVRFTLVPADGKLRAITYIADATYFDEEGRWHIVDAKGYAKEKVYRLKKRFMAHMGLTIEEL